jgi:hypothetical protein
VQDVGVTAAVNPCTQLLLPVASHMHTVCTPNIRHVPNPAYRTSCAPPRPLTPQLRNALALATVLGRTLILPPLWCGLDRYWAPHAGTIPGAGTTLPFQCPADHVLRLEGEGRGEG